MTPEELHLSAKTDPVPPKGLRPEVVALWHAKKGEWDQAHQIAQDIHTPLGSWIHALLHLIEGDVGNAAYWFRLANQPVRHVAEIAELWDEIAEVILANE